MNCFKVAGRKTGVRTWIQCSQSSAMFLCIKLLRESETKLGVFLSPPPFLLILNRPEIYSCICQVVD